MNVGCDDMHTLSPRDGPLLTPHSTLWLPDDPSGTFARSSLWAVHIFRLLEPHETRALVALALEHAAANGWSTRRHKHHPTTDIAVERETAPALHSAVKPLVARVVLPTLALHYGFELCELQMRDLFVVRYQQGAQDRLTPHRDGNLLSFSILLSDPSEFEGGGLRFHSLGPACDACGGLRAAAATCRRCDGVGRLALPGCGCGDLTTHSGKLLHEGARVTSGTRFVLVGFVHVTSPEIDHEFISHGSLANSSAVGAWADHECVGGARLSPPSSPQREMHTAFDDETALAAHLFGG
ncbi:hypothetical protein EMIHUDRAFT_253598 [Emiliania huxleyi CCMP1516]|uniref:Fe2OG dioxygenase domain-containing protein n=2 Tax=Emiliania huxleyi TaxID=2903 RepID=A0A0D3K632_EMIH1|nr:hypothetical protein EMIHUDRAFT_253598 [Emiliania huxleyi CCMP1516]EOD31217.1 hypothetical protein EMIHUDRAFT_253598 [Emiliania huxleyi CCMP1516]|eukprot:XP_005783646.1 hypothetical protein EMIHUDRAFT_253598 [Emiliania huxleyi CCMP1516]